MGTFRSDRAYRSWRAQQLRKKRAAGGGGGSPPPPEPGPDSLQFVDTYTFSAVASGDVPLPDSPLILLDVRGVTSIDNGVVNLQVTTDGFTTVKAGASDYSTVVRGYSSAADNFSLNSSVARLVKKLGNAAGESWAAECKILFANDATEPTVGMADPSFHNTAGFASREMNGWVYRAANVVNGIRLSAPTGTLTFTVDVYAVLAEGA